MFKKARNIYLINAIVLFAMAFIMPIFLIIMAIINPENLKIGEVIGYSFFAIIIFGIAGAINIALFISEKSEEEKKNKGIKELEEELKDKQEE